MTSPFAMIFENTISCGRTGMTSTCSIVPRSRSLIIDGILMIRDQKSPMLVREMLVAYLPHNHREALLEPAA